MARRRGLVYFGFLYVASAWALNTVLVKYAFAHFQPLAFTGLRFAIMAPLGFVLARIMGERVCLHKRDIPLLVACGACGYGIYQYVWVLGLDHTTPYASALIGSLSPMMTLAIVAVRGTERVPSGRWAGAAIALAGVAIFEGVFTGTITFHIGDGLTIISAALFAMFNVLTARLLDRYTPVTLVAISMSIGTLMILPGAIPAMLHQNWHAVAPADYGVLLYAIVFPILLTYPVWSYGISQVGAGRASLFQFIVPIITGALSVALLHDRILPHQIAGVLVCIAGMAISQLLGRYSLTALWAWRTQGLER